MKTNVFDLPRPERPVETRSFAGGVDLTLRAPDAADIARGTEWAQRLTEDYITGSDLREAGPFPEPVPVTATLFQSVAMVAAMQVVDTPADAYSPVELIVYASRQPREWLKIQAWAGDLISTWSKSRGN